MHGTSLWISHFLLLGSFIKFSLSDCATPLLSECLSTPPLLLLSPSTLLLFALIDTHTHSNTFTHAHIALHSAQPAPQWVARLYKYWNSGTVRVPAESTFHFAMPSSQHNCSPFSASVAQCVQQRVLIALESLSSFYQKWHNLCKSTLKKKKRQSHKFTHPWFNFSVCYRYFHDQKKKKYIYIYITFIKCEF